MSYSVIPPYILRNIIDNCAGPQQESARRTLTHVQQLMAEPHRVIAPADIARPGQVSLRDRRLAEIALKPALKIAIGNIE